jgi:phytoene dehydrogenase-like protein
MPTKKTTKTSTDTTTDVSKEIATVKSQATKAVTYATSLEVTSDEDYAAALEEGKRIKDFLNGVTARKELITKPMYAAYKSTMALFKTVEDPASEALDMIRAKMTRFHNEKRLKEEQERAKLAAKVESGKMKPETAMKKAEAIETTEKTVATGSAQATMRTVKKYRVVNKEAIPPKFLLPDMVAIKASFRAGLPVNGVEEYEEQELAIS